MKRLLRSIAALATAALVATACSSSSHSSSGASAASRTYTVGLLTDYTGAAAASFKTSVQGVEAGIHRAGGEGYSIHYVLADTGTSVSGALSAAQGLVERDHVYAVISES